MAIAQDSPQADNHGAPTPPSLLQVLWMRKPLILFGAVVGLIIGAIYFAQRKPLYESTALVLVVKKVPEVTGPGFDFAAQVDDYLSTHIRILQSPSVVGKAVKAGELNRLRSFQNNSEPAAVTAIICGSLSVSRETAQSGYGGPSTLNLSYRGPDPEDCKVILSTIIQSYKDFLDERYQNTSKQSIGQLMAANNQLKEELKQSEQAQNELIKNGPILIGKDGTTLNEEMLKGLQTHRSEQANHQVELSTRLASIEQALKEGRDPTPLIEMDPSRAVVISAAAPATGGIASTSDESLQKILDPLVIEERVLLGRYGAAHPEVVEIQKRIEIIRGVLKGKYTTTDTRLRTPQSTRAFLDSGAYTLGLLAAPLNQGPWVSAAMLFSTRSSLPDVAIYVRNLQAQLIYSKMYEERLQEQAKKEADIVRSYADFRKKAESLRKEIASTETLLNSIRDKILQTKVVRDMGGYEATALAEPGWGYQIDPKPTPIFTMALLLGMAAGIALAWVAEATDKSFRTPEEVRRRLGLAVVGHVPRIKPDVEAQRQHDAGLLPIDPSICAFYHSKSLEAESFRGIRTTLYFNAQNENCKIIQVTSPNMGDGKTTLATNLAVSIAQSGKKILLIDADFRRPRLHRMFGVKGRIGLVAVIQDEADLPDAIQPTVVPNLSLLPCGVRPPNPAEVLTSPRFKEVLETLRDKYDIILVDTPPLLAVSDPSVVASQVDGVLITIRVSKNGRPAAERARDILATLEANILGVIVNGIGGGQSKEGYGASHYHYHYQYQYAYEPSDNRSYYQDNDADASKNGDGCHDDLDGPGTNGRLEPEDPDAVVVASRPINEESSPRNRIAGSRRRTPDKGGLVAGFTSWLRSTLWH